MLLPLHGKQYAVVNCCHYKIKIRKKILSWFLNEEIDVDYFDDELCIVQYLQVLECSQCLPGNRRIGQLRGNQKPTFIGLMTNRNNYSLGDDFLRSLDVWVWSKRIIEIKITAWIWPASIYSYCKPITLAEFTFFHSMLTKNRYNKQYERWQ